MENINVNQIYTTSYLILATALSFNFPVFALDKSNPNEIKFIFEHLKELDDMVESFWRKELRFEPTAFEDQRKSLLRRINEINYKNGNKEEFYNNIK